jgi:cytochrome c oxidase subunit 2
MTNRTLGILGITLLAVGIVAAIVFAIVLVALPGATGSGQSQTGNGNGSSTYSSAGQRIFDTGVGHGGPIARSGGYGMMGSGGCVDCHGSDGRGGTIGMMNRFSVPDITYSNLTSEHLDDQGETEEAWTQAQIEDAIRTGTEPSGETLDRFMPRWDMDDTDMADLIAYLKELG